MIKLCLFDGIKNFLNKFSSVLIYSLVAIAIVICIVIMCKYPGSRKFLFYVVSAIVIMCGVTSGIMLFKDINMHGYNNGDIKLLNSVGSCDFYHSTNSIVFNVDDSNMYVYENNFVKTRDFDAEHNKYKVELNDYYLFDSVISSGSTYSLVNMDFRDENGVVTCSGNFKIIVKFLSDKTTLKVFTEDKTFSEYLSKHFKDYGFRLKISLMGE